MNIWLLELYLFGLPIMLEILLKWIKANVLNSYDEKYHVYDHEFGEYISNEKQRKKRGIFYTIIIGMFL